MKIYISEKDMGKVDIVICGNELMVDDYVELRSLEQLKQEVRREFAEKLKDKMPKLDEGEKGDYFNESEIDDLLKQLEAEE